MLDFCYMYNELSIISLSTVGNSYSEDWCTECDAALKNEHACTLETKALKSSEKERYINLFLKAKATVL